MSHNINKQLYGIQKNMIKKIFGGNCDNTSW